MQELHGQVGHTPKNEQNNNRKAKRMNNNVALFHIFPLQSTANPCFSSPRGNREENKRVNRVERRFLN